jgi:WD40 repeat protein
MALASPLHRTSRGVCLLLVGLVAVVACSLERRGAAQPPKETGNKGGIVLWRYTLDSLNSAGDAYLARVNPEDKKPTRLTKEPDAGAPTFPIALSPDGRSVACSKAEVDGEKATFVVYVRSLDEPRKAAVRLGVNGYCPCWSADGRHAVVVTDQDGAFEHHLIDVKAGKKKTLSLPTVETPPGAKGRVGHVVTDWSRDGRWFLTMCLTGDEKEENARLYRVKSDGSEALPVKGVRSGRWGRFSPDGKRILYTGSDEKGRPRLFVVDVDAGKPSCLSPELNGCIDDAGFCWSPDGKRVAYLWLNTDRPQFGQEYEMFLMVIDADGKNQVTVLNEKSAFVKPLRYPQWR